MHHRFIAIGGGGATHAADPALDDFVLAHAGQQHPRVGYIGWAATDADAEVRLRNLRAQWAHSCEVIDALPPDTTPAAAARWLDAFDVLYAAGGNALRLLQALRNTGLDHAVPQAMQRGLLLVGVSAGAAVWFDCALSDAEGPGLRRLDGIGALPGSFCPHYDSEPERRPAFEAAIAQGDLPAGLAVDDGVAVLVTDGKPMAICSARAGGQAWRVTAEQHLSQALVII